VFEELNSLLAQKDIKILFVGLGNLLKRDDGVGVYISSRLKPGKNISVLTAEVAVENYIGKINSLRPDVCIFIDCSDLSASAGSCRLLPAGAIHDLTFNTHNISLKKVSEFFRMPVYLLGIQPENIDFGEDLSPDIVAVADKIIKLINREEAFYGN
jgi:hydrogenase 3 maturation protease